MRGAHMLHELSGLALRPGMDVVLGKDGQDKTLQVTVVGMSSELVAFAFADRFAPITILLALREDGTLLEIPSNSQIHVYALLGCAN